MAKPCRAQDLLEAVQRGLDRHRDHLKSEKALTALKERFDSLTTRQHKIMIEVARGRLSKEIAGDIGITEATVKGHRSRLMRKMEVRSLAALVRMADNSSSYPRRNCKSELAEIASSLWLAPPNVTQIERPRAA